MTSAWGQPVGRILSIRRFPVKSLAGEVLDRAEIVKSGLSGDRGYAFVKPQLLPFPWLTGRDVPALLLYSARYDRPDDPRSSRVVVTTPSGIQYDLADPALLDEICRAAGTEVSLIRRSAGIPDCMAASLLSRATVAAVAKRIGANVDPLRFRPNVFVETTLDREGVEDAWVGGLIRLGDGDAAPILAAVERDTRCVMVNIDPTTADQDTDVLKELGRSRKACIGIYASVVRPGTAETGAPLYFQPV